MGTLVYINGAPGVGKLTIARHAAARLNARVLDNHAIYNVGFALADFRSPEFYDAVRAVRDVAYEQILKLPDHESVILTAADFGDTPWGQENHEKVEQLAQQRQWEFFSVALICEPDEHRRRIVSNERGGRGKLQDGDAVAALTLRPIIRGQGERSIQLDVSALAAVDAASRLVEWISRVR